MPEPVIEIVEVTPQTAVDVVEVTQGIVSVQVPGPAGPAGRDGIDGKDGRDGVDGQPGRDGVDGQPGRDGVDGQDGKDASFPALTGNAGKLLAVNTAATGVEWITAPQGGSGNAGQDGQDGEDGTDGVGVSSASVNGSGHLIVTLTNGSTIDAGLVRGADGQDGEDGSDGQNGAAGPAGRGVLSATVNGSGRLILTLTDATSVDAGVVKGADGAQGPAGVGTQGPAGANGLSAYQIAVTNGFVGTEAAWLASLKGEKGDTGPAGTGGGGSGPAVPDTGEGVSIRGAHRYWGIQFTENNGGNYALTEIQFRTAPNGPQAATGGTPSGPGAIGTDYVIAYAFDTDPNSMYIFGDVGRVVYDFGAPIVIAEVMLAARTDGFLQDSPKAFNVQYSDDGTGWTTGWGATDQVAWGLGQKRVFKDPEFQPYAPSSGSDRGAWRSTATYYYSDVVGVGVTQWFCLVPSTAEQPGAGTHWSQFYKAGGSSTASLAYQTNALAGDMTMTTANTFYNPITITLADVGTWMITAQLAFSRANTTLTHYTGKITAGATVISSGTSSYPSANPHYVMMPLTGVVATTAANTVVTLAGTANTAGCVIKATPGINGTGLTKATQITAIKIA